MGCSRYVPIGTTAGGNPDGANTVRGPGLPRRTSTALGPPNGTEAERFMIAYILRRIVFMVPTFFIVLTAVFFLLNIAPGDSLNAMFADVSPNEADKDRVRHELGLDQPMHVRYATWLGKMFQGDFGRSFVRGQSVLSIIEEKIPISIRLGVLSLMVAWIIAIPIGVISAVRADTGVDYVVRGAAILMLAVPNFWVAVLVVVVPAFLWGIPLRQTYIPFNVDPISNITFFFIPAIVLGVQLTGATLRMTRAMMLEVLRSDYIRTARAKGLQNRVVIYRHALKNALIPVVTILGAQSALLVGGTVIIEQVFGVPGVGSLMYTSAIAKDFPVVQAVVVILSIFLLFTNLLVDLTYAWLDPRIKYH